MRAVALRLLGVLLLALLARGVAAGDLAPAEVRAIRAVVQGQLDAFRTDDAKRAFSYASPGIQQLFATPERFLAMVQGQYPMVYRPASVSFLQPQSDDGQVIQSVRITDKDGASWLVLYVMEQQPDKSWRIAGCHAVPSTARTASGDSYGVGWASAHRPAMVG